MGRPELTRPTLLVSWVCLKLLYQNPLVDVHVYTIFFWRIDIVSIPLLARTIILFDSKGHFHLHFIRDDDAQFIVVLGGLDHA
jgi:DUF1365 family protein